MRLTIFNGSPRGKKSNSKVLMDHFCAAFTGQADSGTGNGGSNNGAVETAYLNRIKDTEKHVELFKKAEHVILVFPLYTDAMPGIVKHFIEALEPLCGRKGNPALGFVIQSGFREPHHSRFVARYLEKMAARLGCTHTGTAIRGGVEGIQVMPPWMTKKLFGWFRQLGANYAETGRFDEEVLRQLAPRERLSLADRIVFRLMKITGFDKMYWNMKLKENKAFDRRFARPFEDS